MFYNKTFYNKTQNKIKIEETIEITVDDKGCNAWVADTSDGGEGHDE